jgi:hypothetical protein
MKLARVSVFFCAACVWANVVFAQASQIHDRSTAAIQSTAKKQSHDKANPRITLRVEDFANIYPSVLAGARKVTTEIFAAAGVQTVWLDCSVYEADCGAEAERRQIILRILGPSLDKDIVADDEALGFAIPCHKTDGACLSYILYWRIRALAAADNLSPDRILGHVMAHEIGHALLGPNTHEPFSIMQAMFSIHDTERMLHYTSGQSKRLQAELVARRRVSLQTGTLKDGRLATVDQRTEPKVIPQSD